MQELLGQTIIKIKNVKTVISFLMLKFQIFISIIAFFIIVLTKNLAKILLIMILG